MSRKPLERIIHYMCLMLDELSELKPDQVDPEDLNEMLDKTQQILDWGRSTKKNFDN